MENFIQSLQIRLESSILEIADGHLNKLQQIKRCYEDAFDIVEELNVYQTGHPFKTEAEEIKFFKEINPSFHKEHVYYSELFQLESNKPIGSKKDLKYYYQFQIKIWQQFIKRHNVFFNYIRIGSTEFDLQYFTKNNNRPLSIAGLYPATVPNQSTPHSQLLAMLQAYEKLCHYANQQINLLVDNKTHSTANTFSDKANLSWTDSKVALIELAYALQAKGSVNFGASDVKQIIRALEAFFNINLGNFYRVYMDMLIRKKGRTPYLDSMKEFLERRMDEAE